MNKKILRILSGITTVALMMIIFFLSSQNAEQSTHSSEFIMKLMSFIFSALRLNVNDAVTYAAVHSVIRKLAHFSEYGALGISTTVFISTFEIKKLLTFIMPWLACILYSCSDEFHQTFIGGRSGEARDVLIDSLGALTGIAVFFTARTVIAAITARKNRRLSK